jgi:hypothetical protein
MKRRSLLIVTALALCLASVAFAQPYPANGYIGLFGDAAGTNCCITAVGAPATAFIIAKLEGATQNGITGAEYRIEIAQENGSAPTGYFFSYAAAPGNSVALGDPIDQLPQDATNPSGANIAWATCQPDPVGPQVTLGTLTIINFGAGTPFYARTKQKNPPSNPATGDCPALVLCDAPVFTVVCTTVQTQNNMNTEGIGFVSKVNLACTPNPCGPVAVAENTWSGVKELFR